MSSNLKEIIDIALQILERLPITIWIMALSAAAGLLLGLLLAIVRIKKSPIPYALATLYISFMRCTPTIVQLFLIFYGLPQLLTLINLDVNDWSPFVFAVIALSMHSAAYFSEVIRSSYMAVGSGQMEAAYSVGMSYFQALRRVILPQAFGISLPVLSNNIISLLKETSLVFSIGITDMMGQVNIIVGNNYGTNVMTVYIVISILYWLLSILIGRGTAYLEKKQIRSGYGGLARSK
ncbi:amino acid ABC transporter permease [Paenibacillus sp. NPDC058071]|uniref:amino acid ABC transporter permease n=1 Tax=Paenibacillus sp. NPDC058071 TaxID=3346326 RepID=UPI0036DD2C9E